MQHPKKGLDDGLKQSLEIRKATEADTAALAKLMGELGYPATTEQMGRRFSEINGEANYVTLVAEVQEAVVGMAGAFSGLAFESDDRYVRIIALVVTEEFRNMRVGKALVKGVEAWALERDITKIAVNTGKRRIDSHFFYEKEGFEGSGVGYYKLL